MTTPTYGLTLRVDRLDDGAATVVTIAAVDSFTSIDPAVLARTLRAVADQLDPPKQNVTYRPRLDERGQPRPAVVSPEAPVRSALKPGDEIELATADGTALRRVLRLHRSGMNHPVVLDVYKSDHSGTFRQATVRMTDAEAVQFAALLAATAVVSPEGRTAVRSTPSFTGNVITVSAADMAPLTGPVQPEGPVQRSAWPGGTKRGPQRP